MTIALIVVGVLAGELLLGIVVGRFVGAGQRQIPPAP